MFKPIHVEVHRIDWPELMGAYVEKKKPSRGSGTALTSHSMSQLYRLLEAPVDKDHALGKITILEPLVFRNDVDETNLDTAG